MAKSLNLPHLSGGYYQTSRLVTWESHNICSWSHYFFLKLQQKICRISYCQCKLPNIDSAGTIYNTKDSFCSRNLTLPRRELGYTCSLFNFHLRPNYWKASRTNLFFVWAKLPFVPWSTHSKQEFSMGIARALPTPAHKSLFSLIHS
jgi:hypothetical protein